MDWEPEDSENPALREVEELLRRVAVLLKDVVSRSDIGEQEKGALAAIQVITLTQADLIVSVRIGQEPQPELFS